MEPQGSPTVDVANGRWSDAKAASRWIEKVIGRGTKWLEDRMFARLVRAMAWFYAVVLAYLALGRPVFALKLRCLTIWSTWQRSGSWAFCFRWRTDPVGRSFSWVESGSRPYLRSFRSGRQIDMRGGSTSQ